MNNELTADGLRDLVDNPGPQGLVFDLGTWTLANAHQIIAMMEEYDEARRVILIQARQEIRMKKALEAASKWLSDVWPIISAVKPEWQAVNMWSDYDEDVFNRRAAVNLAIIAALQQGDR